MVESKKAAEDAKAAKSAAETKAKIAELAKAKVQPRPAPAPARIGLCQL